MVNKEVLDFLRKREEVLARLNIARESMQAFISGSTTFDMVSFRVHPSTLNADRVSESCSDAHLAKLKQPS